MCAAEVLTMAGVFAFPALLPTFVAQWALTNTEAGWIAGIYFAAYAASVPLLMALTDRIDARVVYVAGALLAAASAAGFALVAAGFWTAMVLRALAGIGLAATFMPGLKVLVDRYRGTNQSRAVAFYTSSFSLGTAASFLLAGELAAAVNWRLAFAAAAAAAGAAAALMALAIGPASPDPNERPARILDFRPALANRQAMGYVLGYGVHCWELFTLRSWMVALLAFTLATDPGTEGWWPSPTTVSTVAGLVGMAASFAGNELAVRFGRILIVRLMMMTSAVMAAIIGFAAELGYGAMVALTLVYNAAVLADSAALTAGAVEAADLHRRGATLALHSLCGFAAAAVGPVALGLVLDLTGGAGTAASWGWGFASVAAVGVLGPLALRLATGGLSRGPADGLGDGRR